MGKLRHRDTKYLALSYKSYKWQSSNLIPDSLNHRNHDLSSIVFCVYISTTYVTTFLCVFQNFNKMLALHSGFLWLIYMKWQLSKYSQSFSYCFTFFVALLPHGMLYTCVLSPFSHVDSATLWTVALQAPLSMGILRQEYWSGLPCHTARDLPDSGIKPMSLRSPALSGRFFTTSTTWDASCIVYLCLFPSHTSLPLKW